MPDGLSRGLALAREGLQVERQAVICDRVGSTPELAADYVKVAGELGEAAARCPLAPTTAQKAAHLATAAERLAGAAASSKQSAARAAALYRQAAARLLQAAALYPEAHAAAPALERHASELQVRAVYLESLGGAPAALPPEEHIGELALEALAPAGGAEQAQEASPAPAAPDVAAAPAPGPAGPGAPAPRPASPAGAGEAAGPAAQGAAAAPARTDFLHEATRLESRARDLEAGGQRAAALDAYRDCLDLYAHVLKRDPRAGNPKIKQMVRERMEDLLTQAEALKALAILSG